MPLYLDFFNLIVNKSSVIIKYDGGLAQFKEDYHIGVSEQNSEDNELFLIAAMDDEDIAIKDLITRGLHFDSESQYSEDFVIIPRYGDKYWEADWLEGNNVFVWHVNADEHLKQKAFKMSTITINELQQLFENGEQPFAPII